ncbi:MAG: isochorismatase family protein [Candidatus Krumholzibacteriia bacterium]
MPEPQSAQPGPVRSVPPRLEKQRAALVLIDMQERFRDLIDDGPAVTAACSRLVRFCRQLEIPVLVTEHYSRGLGVTITELRQLFDPFQPIEKIAFSCCGSGEFNDALDRTGRDQIVLCGIEAHVCVYQTAFDLLRKGKQVAVAADAVTARSPVNRDLGLRRMSELGVQTMGVEMIMFEILRQAKTEEFQAVAPILKE